MGYDMQTNPSYSESTSRTGSSSSQSGSLYLRGVTYTHPTFSTYNYDYKSKLAGSYQPTVEELKGGFADITTTPGSSEVDIPGRQYKKSKAKGSVFPAYGFHWDESWFIVRN